MPLNTGNPDLLKRNIEKLDKLLNELKKIGVKNLRVANPQLMTYISKYYCDFNILASTSLEYKTIWEYQNFIKEHPNVRQIVPSHDINKNFKLLSILRKKYQNVEIELMVNEGCIQGCPNRMFHEQTVMRNNKPTNTDIILSDGYCSIFCQFISCKYPIQSLVIGNNIYPWELEEYARIGINNFKLVGRDRYKDNFLKILYSYNTYLKGVDDMNSIKDATLNFFTTHLADTPVLDNLALKDYKKYLPDIKHFVKYGHLCSSICGVECDYCYKCAAKIQKVFKKQQEEAQKQPHYVSSCEIYCKKI